jgi:hypothetical protein
MINKANIKYSSKVNLIDAVDMATENLNIYKRELAKNNKDYWFLEHSRLDLIIFAYTAQPRYELDRVRYYA